jgi:hypothetical protein
VSGIRRLALLALSLCAISIGAAVGFAAGFFLGGELEEYLQRVYSIKTAVCFDAPGVHQGR